ncbi:RloB domain-containing protein [Olivibacter oleidegradans]|uniref:RloB domain-containing protein n=1 Tax=Olivibacter oleidegradans TaxID=760123 RepID=A0ABV6HPT4_9SPHI
MSRQVYKEMIEHHLKPILGNEFRYEKNSKQMYALLKEYGSLDNAIRNAKRLAERFKGRQDYANHNPSTMVYQLIE